MFESQVIIRTEGGREVTPAGLQRKFTKLKETFADFTPTWQKVRDIFYGLMQEQFQSERPVGGVGDWSPLKPSYAAYKIKKYGNKPILTATGRLRQSLESPAESESILRIEPKQMEVGTSVSYAAYHQTGTKKMPRRPVLPTVAKLLTKGKFKKELVEVSFDRARKVWIE